MKKKIFFICWLPTFLVVFLLNGLFHGQLAADFFEANLIQYQSMMHKMKDTNPLWVGILDLGLTFGMTYFINIEQSNRTTLRRAAFAGGLINLISSGTWNLANAAMFIDWPMKLTIVDICWHVILGTAGGLLIAVLYNKFNKQAGR